MDLRISGKRALVFGGSRGVGRAVARALAANGVDVAVCARKEWAARKVAAEAAENSGVRAIGYKMDAWDAQSTVSLINRIVDDFGVIDILFGIARRPALEDGNVLSPDCWHSQLDSGFLRFKAVSETLTAGMQDRQWGRILWMIPWWNAGTSIERQLHSVMAAALSAWLQSIAANLAEDNVIVNVLRPPRMSKTTETGAAFSPRYGRSRRGSMPATADGTLSVRQVAAFATFLLSNLASGVSRKDMEFGRDT